MCGNGPTQNLIAYLGGFPAAGGVWTFAGTGHNSNYDPTIDAPGVYTYTIGATAPCTSSVATATVSETNATNWYADADGDGAGDPLTLQLACVQPVGFVASSNDGCPADPLKITAGICGCGQFA